MRTNISCSFLRSRKVAGLAVLFSAFFGASSNVLAQEGSSVISLEAGQSTTVRVSVSRLDTTATRILVFTNDNTPEWTVLEDPSSGSVVLEPDTPTSLGTTTGTTVTVVYTLSPPEGNIGLGANDNFVVGVFAGDDRATLTFSVTIAADFTNSPPQILDTAGTIPNDSTSIEVRDGSTQVEITLRATDADGDVLTWSVSTYSGVSGSAAFSGGGSTATGTEVTVVYQNAGGIVLTADTPRLTVEVTDGSDSDSVQVYLVVEETVDPVRIPPVISYGGDDQVSTVPVDSYARVPAGSFVLSASNPDPEGGELSWSLTTPSTGTAVFVVSGGGTSNRLTTGGDDAPATIRFTRPDPDDDFQGTTFRITATGVDSELYDSVLATIANVPNTTPTIAGDTSSEIHSQVTTVYFTFVADDLDPGDEGNLEWGLGDVSEDRSTAVFVDAAGDEVSNQTGTTVRVSFSQSVNSFDGDVATRTFAVTLSDGLATARSTVTVEIGQNQVPEIVSIDGRTTNNLLVSPNSLDVTFSALASDDYQEDQLQWSLENLPSDGESTVTFIATDGQALQNPVGTDVVIRLERVSSQTTTSFTLGVLDTGGRDNTADVTVTVAGSTPTIRFPDLQPISEGETVVYTFDGDDDSLGQKAGLTWTVESTDNVVVSLSSDQGSSVTVTATFQGRELEGSYVLRVTDSDDNYSERTVTVQRTNEVPVVTPGSVSRTLPVGQSTADISFSAVDTVGLTTLTWSFDVLPDGDSTVRFVADNGGRSTTISATTVRVRFEGPTPSSETDVVRSFVIQVDDGVGGASTARAWIVYATPDPVIYYQDVSTDLVTVDLEPGRSTASISLTARGGGNTDNLNWSFTTITDSLEGAVFFLDGSSTSITVVGSRDVVVWLDFSDDAPVDGNFTVNVRAGESGPADSLRVNIDVPDVPDQSLFRIRMFLGGAAR